MTDLTIRRTLRSDALGKKNIFKVFGYFTLIIFEGLSYIKINIIENGEINLG